jgi:RNA-directed DNA polymerase
MQTYYANLKALSRDRNSLFHPLEMPSWTSTSWKTMESNIARIQDRIAKATLKRKSRKVRDLQRLLVRSFSARLKAVRQVAKENAPKSTPGINRELWASLEHKYQASLQLSSRRSHLLAPHSNSVLETGQKPMELLTLKDLARQALWFMALDPVLESTSEPLSFGFRPYRGCWDAHAHIRILLSKEKSPQWILVGNIQTSSNSKKEAWLLENTPMEKGVLNSWLQAGFLRNGQLLPPESPSAKDVSIAHILWNHTLNGLESVLRKDLEKTCERRCDTLGVHLVRHGMDFLVIGSSRCQLEMAKGIIEEFLSFRGLQLNLNGSPKSEEMGKRHIIEGFHFLHWAFRKTSNGFLLQTISKNSLRNHFRLIRHTVKKSFGVPPEILIYRLNPIIQDWCQHHQCCSNLWSVWNRCNQYLFRQLFKWCRNRHPHKSKFWIYERYWKIQENWKTFCATSHPNFSRLLAYGLRKKRISGLPGSLNLYSFSQKRFEALHQ